MFKKGQISNPKGCPKGAHHIGRPKDIIKRECAKLATEAAPLILARLIRTSLGESTEQVVTEDGECVKVPAPSPSQIKAGEVVLSYAIEKVAERFDLNDTTDRPGAEELLALRARDRANRP
jgi:hypothetical protein